MLLVLYKQSTGQAASAKLSQCFTDVCVLVAGKLFDDLRSYILIARQNDKPFPGSLQYL